VAETEKVEVEHVRLLLLHLAKLQTGLNAIVGNAGDDDGTGALLKVRGSVDRDGCGEDACESGGELHCD